MRNLNDHLAGLDENRIDNIINELISVNAHQSIVDVYISELDRRWRKFRLENTNLEWCTSREQCDDTLCDISAEHHPLNDYREELISGRQCDIEMEQYIELDETVQLSANDFDDIPF